MAVGIPDDVGAVERAGGIDIAFYFSASRAGFLR